MSFDRVWGHDRPIRVLRRALAAGRVPHAYLFWGPEGVGKERVAREVAKALLCASSGAMERAGACGACPSCVKFEAGSHPDLHVLAAEKASVGVGEIRALQETLSYQAFERGRKVAILPEAFRMTREASNALLKTLEEPSAGIHIFLLAQHRSQLLPTLVSRCQSLRFDALSEDEVERALRTGGMEPELARAVAEISGGCPGAVMGEEPEALLELDAEVGALWNRWGQLGVAERFAVSSRWAAEKDRLGPRLDRLERRLQRSAREQARGALGGPRAEAVLETLFRVRHLLRQNVNTQLAIDALLFGLGGGGWEETL